jgi:hypothetical protein
MDTTDAYAAILAERAYQLEKGFTSDKDDDLMPHKWTELLYARVHQVNQAMTVEDFRTQLVKVAAVAVAAIEAFDRAVH